MVAIRKKTVRALLSGLPCTVVPAPGGKMDDDVEVTGIAYSSNRVKEGDLFFCVVGFKADGHGFAQDAVARGARAIVCQRKLDVDVPQFIVPDSRLALSLASSAFFDDPSSRMRVIGVTGTNGKTTTAFLVEWVLRRMGRTTGLIGTVETRIAGKTHHSERTTPESYDLQELFSDMVDAGVTDCVMEVSSQGLDLSRVKGTSFFAAAFSNLTQDHLDYHKTMENYFAAKCTLFTDYGVRKAAVCIDDAYGVRIADAARAAASSVMTTGFSDGCDLTACDITYEPTHTELTLCTPAGSRTFTTPLVGRFNVENIMLASALCLEMGIALDDVVGAMEEAPQVPGRLERVNPRHKRDFSVLVDYSHTPDAIEKAVEVVRAVAKGRTIVVFGCGGDRDATKRPKMGRAALLGDFAVVTSDNPRSEDPLAIIADILPGMEDGRDRYVVEPDRRKAIRLAVSMARPGDCVLIAGKGHEDYQLVGNEVLSFDDRIVAAEEMDAL